MAKIVEGQLPYTWWTGIEIDTNKVIKILLREENNLIQVNWDNELYTDLQLADWIKPTDEFPVGVTVGKVLASDWWWVSGMLLNMKTTSWDYSRWIYGQDWKLYFDNWTWTFTQIYSSTEVDTLLNNLRNSLATVAFSGDYNDLINRPQIVQLQADWNQTDVDSPDYIKNKPSIPTKTSELTNDSGFIDSNVNNLANYTLSYLFSAVATSGEYSDLLNAPAVIDNLSSTSTTDALSAKQGKELNDKINDLFWQWKFLSLWNATTGQPMSFPYSTPYNYSTWDYYLVEVIWTGTNYRPDWASYSGSASTVVETDELEVWDVYIYDWQVWLLQTNHWKTVSFANLAGQPSDNAALSNALNAKADDNAVVKLTWNQTVAGVKTFSSSPIVPAPTNNTDAATKKYVDDNIASATQWAVSDTAYWSSWDWVTGIAPSKNAVYDKIESVVGSISNATVNFKQNSVTKGSITMNQSAGSDVNLETVIPVTQSWYDALPASKTTDWNLYIIYW